MWLSAALSRFGIAVEGGPLGTNLPQTPEFLVLIGVRRGSFAVGVADWFMRYCLVNSG
jgi:hypothetical protein